MCHSHYKRNALVATVAGCFALAGLAVAQSQPAAPAEQPATSHPAMPAQQSKPATPAESQPAMSHPALPAQSQTSGSNPSQMSTMGPSKSDTAVSAFQKLDAAKAGYVTKEQAVKLDGFDFTQADKNKDGKLDRDEFNAAWVLYSGKPQS